MGTVISEDGTGSSEINGGEIDWLRALPEGCISEALSMTSPRDACRLSLVGSTFRSAAESDAVWERFLPIDWVEIVTSSSTPSLALAFTSKKQLYLHLCNHPLIIDGGTKSVSLEKSTGKKCVMLAARELSIVWGDTPRYWRWTSHPESRFSEVAELLDVCWLDIHGTIKTCMLSPDTAYAAYLVFKLTSEVFGFEQQPAEVSIGVVGDEIESQTVYLDPDGGQRRRFQIVPRRVGRQHHWMMNMMMPPISASSREDNNQYAKKRSDGWMEIEFGEYINKKQQDDRELQMKLMEVRGGHWKRGLIVQGIEIRPKV